jgi:uncharacterized membrane-anchored protein
MKKQIIVIVSLTIVALFNCGILVAKNNTTQTTGKYQ